MSKRYWLFPAIFLILSVVTSLSQFTLAGRTPDSPTVSHYECVDEDGDEACDNPPEDYVPSTSHEVEVAKPLSPT